MDAITRSNRVMEKGADYTTNIERRLLNTKRYNEANQRALSALQNYHNNPEESRQAHQRVGEMYNNTPYSRNTYMGLNQG